MSASRARALTSREVFRRGGLVFGRTPVEIPDDHPLDQVLAILREPVLTIQVDEDGDGQFVTMKPAAREAAIAHLDAKLSVIAQIMAAPDTPEEPKQDVPAGDPAGGDSAPGNPTPDAPTPLEAAIDATAQAGEPQGAPAPAPLDAAGPHADPKQPEPVKPAKAPKAPKASK